MTVGQLSRHSQGAGGQQAGEPNCRGTNDCWTEIRVNPEGGSKHETKKGVSTQELPLSWDSQGLGWASFLLSILIFAFQLPEDVLVSSCALRKLSDQMPAKTTVVPCQRPL